MTDTFYDDDSNDIADIDAMVTVIRAHLIVVETLVEIILTDRLADTDSPNHEAIKFKKTVLSLVKHPDDDFGQLCKETLNDRLNDIIRRVQSL